MIRQVWLPSLAYEEVWQNMRDFTLNRNAQTDDEIWLIEHKPVYTLGQAGKPEHILNPGNIPVVHCDRGGQVTYHGPGQLTAYLLLDLRRYHLYVKEYVQLIEQQVIHFLATQGILAECKPGAPGVYVSLGESQSNELAKIAALGVKVIRGCTYHGLALNVAMDLSPFDGINPCGYAGMPVVDMRGCGVNTTVQEAGNTLAQQFSQALQARL